MTDRHYEDPSKPGRMDVNGEEWWACDPYPTWYRWAEGDVVHGPSGQWADKPNVTSVEWVEKQLRDAEAGLAHQQWVVDKWRAIVERERLESNYNDEQP